MDGKISENGYPRKNMSNVALAIIVKGTDDEPQTLNQALYTIAPYVQGIYITVTGKKSELKKELYDVLEKYKVNVTYEHDKFIWTATEKEVSWLKEFFGYEPKLKAGDEVFCFDKARNYNLEQIPQDKYPWFIWMDCDDAFRYGERLQEVVTHAEENNCGAIYFNYLYQVEYDKTTGKIISVIIQHLRERLLRNNGSYKWIAPIHETLIEQKETIKTDDPRCDIVHLAEDSKRINSLQRNLGNLEYSIYVTEGKDPRPIYYLAKAYYDLKATEADDRAIKLINKYLYGEHKSGWPEERSQANEYLAELMRRKGDHESSIVHLMNALIETPDFPSTYLNIAVSYMLKKQWDRALWWVKLASSFPEKKTTLISNPKDTQCRTLQVIYECCLNLHKVDEAWAAAQKLVELLPGDPNVLNNYRFAEMVRQERDMSKYYSQIANHLRQTGEVAKIKPLLASVPGFMSNNPFIVDLYKQNMPPKYWDKDEIAIICGPGFTNWSPKRLTDPQGSFVGGSEEAVIRISQELQKKGYKVTVYADPGADEGDYEGVQWFPYFKINTLDHFNIIILWRVIQHVDKGWNTKKLYIWNHDIQNNLEWTPERINKIDKAFFLSKWHRDNVTNLSDDKVVISSNGI